MALVSYNLNFFVLFDEIKATIENQSLFLASNILLKDFIHYLFIFILMLIADNKCGRKLDHKDLLYNINKKELFAMQNISTCKSIMLTMLFCLIMINVIQKLKEAEKVRI